MPDFDTAKLVDDTQNQSTGYMFLEDPRNGLGKFKALYGKWLLLDDQCRNRFTYHNGTDIVWKPQWAIEFIAAFERLEVQLVPGLIFSAGPSARSTEFGRQLLREMPGAVRGTSSISPSASASAPSASAPTLRQPSAFTSAHVSSPGSASAKPPAPTSQPSSNSTGRSRSHRLHSLSDSHLFVP